MKALTNCQWFSFLLRHKVMTVLLCSFLLRMLAVGVFQTYTNIREHEMGAMAANILSGHGMSVAYLGPERVTTAFSPFEAYFYALVHYLFGYSELASAIIIIIRSALSVVTAFLIYALVRKGFSERLAFAALVLTAFHPALFFFSSINPDMNRPPFSVFAVALIIWSLIRFDERPTTRRSIVAGIIYAACSLIQSNVISFLPFAFLWMTYVSWKHHKELLSWDVFRTVILMPVALAIVIMPWSVRNYVVSGERVLLRSGFGTMFWIANNPAATPESGHFVLPKEKFNPPGVDSLSRTTLDKVLKASEVERDKILLTEAREFVWQNPKRYVELSVGRLWNYWLGPPIARESLAMRVADTLFSIGSAILFVLSLSALFFRRDRVVALFLMLVLSFTLLYSFVANGFQYYRMDIEPYLLTLALFTLSTLWDKYKRPL